MVALYTSVADMARHLITSAIPYINGIKHLGNLVGSQLPADLYARYMRARGHEVMFICATDEHGTLAEIAAGLTRLHAVDLDGAKTGKPVNMPVIAAFAGAGLRVQAGGGIRDLARLQALLDAGAERAVIGSVAVEDPDTVSGWIDAGAAASACSPRENGGAEAQSEARTTRRTLRGSSKRCLRLIGTSPRRAYTPTRYRRTAARSRRP